jgi:magnesium transporter
VPGEARSETGVPVWVNTGGVIVDCAAYIDGKRVDVDPFPGGLEPWASAEAGDTARHQEEPEGFVWLGLHMPDLDELTAACEALNLDEVSPSEILTPHTRPILQIDDDTLQLVVRTARYDDRAESIALGEMTLLIADHCVVSIRHGQASALSRVRGELERDPELLALGPMAVLAAVVEHVIDDYGPALDGFETDVIEVEREVFSETNRQPVERLYRLKREVRRTVVAIGALQDPFNRMIRVHGRRMPVELTADLSEASDQLGRAVTRANSLSELIDAALTASLAQIQVRQNGDMRMISAWVAMAAVPTMIAGIYGMNFEEMPELGWRLGYPLALFVMAGVVAVLYRFFKRSGWL